MKKIILIIFAVLSLFLTYIYLLIFTNQITVFIVWWKLMSIPNIKIISVKSGPGEYNAAVLIKVANKGIMKFAWLVPEHFSNPTNHFYSLPFDDQVPSIYLTEIDNCKFSYTDKGNDKPIFAGLVLNKEVNPQIITVENAIEHYDEILSKAKSLSKYISENSTSGLSANCL